MDQETAQNLFAQGGIIVALDVPKGTQFGIDYHSWSVGPNFKGVKMIPPGFHFVYYSAVDSSAVGANRTGPRTGFFGFIEQGELMVTRWDCAAEDLINTHPDEEELDRFRDGIRDLDRFLGAYQYDGGFKTWLSLTSHINPETLAMIQPRTGKVSSVSQLFVDPDASPEDAATAADMVPDPDASLRFTEIPKRMFPEGATGMDLSKHMMDRSYTLEHLMSVCYSGEYRNILAELQLAFVAFLVGQVYDAFEQWKQMIHLLCSCDDALATRPELYDDFLSVLHFQLAETPTDFFVDIVSQDNFLVTCLSSLFQRIREVDGVDAALATRAEKFQRSLRIRFSWDFSEDLIEDDPVVVEL